MPSPATIAADPSWPRGRPIRFEGVRVNRGAAEILRGIDLTFEPGRRYVLVGASGAGKSTLLRLLNRLEDPSGGVIRVGMTPLKSLPVRAVRQGVGLVFQGPRPLPGTLAENLAYPSAVRGLPPPGRGAMAGVLAEFGLDPDWLDRDASGLSGGERQRLALAVALGAGPEILALDEPTSALDPASARRVLDGLTVRADGRRLADDRRDARPRAAPRLGETAIVLGGRAGGRPGADRRGPRQGRCRRLGRGGDGRWPVMSGPTLPGLAWAASRCSASWPCWPGDGWGRSAACRSRRYGWSAQLVLLGLVLGSGLPVARPLGRAGRSRW